MQCVAYISLNYLQCAKWHLSEHQVMSAKLTNALVATMPKRNYALTEYT